MSHKNIWLCAFNFIFSFDLSFNLALDLDLNLAFLLLIKLRNLYADLLPIAYLLLTADVW